MQLQYGFSNFKAKFQFYTQESGKFFCKKPRRKENTVTHILTSQIFSKQGEGRISIIQICQMKSVFSSFFLNYLIRKVFFSTAKSKIKIKHRSKILQKISHLSQNKQGMAATQKCLVNSQTKNVTEETGLIHRSLQHPYRQLIFFLYLGVVPCKAAQPLQKMESQKKEKDEKHYESCIERTQKMIGAY